MGEHKYSKILKNFDVYSYYLGINVGFAEVVGAGCKKLALSTPLNEQELNVLLKPTEMAAEDYNAKIFVEKDFLITKLFPENLTKGKNVIFIAANNSVLNDYHNLKQIKAKAIKENNLSQVEDDIAWQFGKLLSYSEEKIGKLIKKNG
ncbi:hypothetical protein FJY84_01130 [Candidatus Bathyarchaeota archaeon]|nr:hypothetical protein [Candidatus Bathyarchaeota archaeon]